MYDTREILKSYKGKRVFITGNTGFKGAWLTYILLFAGADVTGFALKPHTDPNLFLLSGLFDAPNLHQYYADIRDLDALTAAFQATQPEIVFHLAAQPIVRDSYEEPLHTYLTNVNGTLNILECIRTVPGIRSFLNVTTDKVYKNVEWEYGYREDDPLDGFDPYSNSKSCSELITHCYKDSFFADGLVAISTARAGNVIGGGDFSHDRIIPDCIKAIMETDKQTAVIGVRNPCSIRPYQHVLEPLFLYLTIAMKQCGAPMFAGCYNVGPDDVDCLTTGELVSLFCREWNESKDASLPKLLWENQEKADVKHEANFLKLDCSRVKARFGWRPRWHIKKAIEQTVRFTNVWLTGKDIEAEMTRELKEYLSP